MSFLEKLKFAYLKKAHIIKPLIPVIVIILFAIGYSQTKGYAKSRRVWDNLAYIYSFEGTFDKLLETDTAIFNLKKEMDDEVLEDSLLAKLEEHASAWPISLLSDNIFKDVEPPGDIALGDSSYRFTYSDKLAYSRKSNSFLLAKNFKIEKDSFPEMIALIDHRIEGLGLVPDSLYILYMQEWNGTDSIKVRIYNPTE